MWLNWKKLKNQEVLKFGKWKKKSVKMYEEKKNGNMVGELLNMCMATKMYALETKWDQWVKNGWST